MSDRVPELQAALPLLWRWGEGISSLPVGRWTSAQVVKHPVTSRGLPGHAP